MSVIETAGEKREAYIMENAPSVFWVDSASEVVNEVSPSEEGLILF